MKNRLIGLTGMLAAMLAFAIVFGGCPTGDDGSGGPNGGGDMTKFEGTWKMQGSGETLAYTFAGNSFILEVPTGKVHGDFKFTETAITFTPTHSIPAGAPLGAYTMDYEIFEAYGTILKLMLQAGSNGNGVGEMGGLFTKQP
jgi:hypothetical protein